MRNGGMRPDSACFKMVNFTPFPRGSGANLAARIRCLTSCCFPAIARWVPAMGGESRCERGLLSMNDHFNRVQFAALLSGLGPLRLYEKESSQTSLI